MTKPGSLVVDFQRQVLKLGSVRHLYSRISGKLRPEWDWLKIVQGSFPALVSYPESLGALSQEREEPLRFYGGILGRVSPAVKQASFYLNLRAGIVNKGVLFTQGGGGVITESEAEKELLEVKNKLSGMMKAVVI